jgi:CHAT domain-containing protein
LVVTLGKDYRDSQYVADKWSISYYQSAAVLALNRMLKESEAKKPLFALANPVYSEEDPRYIAYKEGKESPIVLAKDPDKYSYRALSTRREWGKELVYAPLPETEDEVKAIAKIFNIKPIPPDVLIGVIANETAFRNTQLDDYFYLHLATHADLPGKVQGIKEPFLLLGQVENRGGDDGFLTLTEVLELKLDAELVVLSACLTGRGKMMEGEGVVNFARAFHHAGARSVLVSLWEVASDETVEYMELFYRYLKEGKTKAEALRLARNKIKSEHPNPFYWAAFILHGER